MKISDVVIYDSENNLEFFKKGSYPVGDSELKKGQSYPLDVIIGAYFNVSRIEKSIERKKKISPKFFSSEKKIKERKSEIFEIVKEDVKDCKKYFNLLDEKEKIRLKKIILKKFEFIKPLSMLAVHDNKFIKSLKNDILPEWEYFSSSVNMLASNASKNNFHISLLGVLNDNLDNFLFENLDLKYLKESAKSISLYFINDFIELVNEYKVLYYGSEVYNDILEVENQYIDELRNMVLNSLRKGDGFSSLNKFLNNNGFSFFENVKGGFKDDCVNALYDCFNSEKRFKTDNYFVNFYSLDKTLEGYIDRNKLYATTYALTEDSDVCSIILNVNKFASLLNFSRKVFNIEFESDKISNVLFEDCLNDLKRNLKENSTLLKEIKNDENVDEDLNMFLIEKNNKKNQDMLNKVKEFFKFITKPLLEMEAGKSVLFLDHEKEALFLNIDIKPEFKNMVDRMLYSKAFVDNFKSMYQDVLEHEKMKLDVNSSELKNTKKIRKF